MVQVMSIRNIFNYPLWFLELFTRSKSFRKNPIIGNKLLNRLGLHVFRTLVSQMIFICRQKMLFFPAPPEDRSEFNRNGFIVKENFLPDDEFKTLSHEIEAYNGDTWESIQGDTITQHIFLDHENLQSLDKCKQFVNQTVLLKLLKWCAGKANYPRFFIQRIMNHYASGDYDPQKSLHSDTFHPAVKCWFFLEDVNKEDGPFTYVPGPHHLSWKRLKSGRLKNIFIIRTKKPKNGVVLHSGT